MNKSGLLFFFLFFLSSSLFAQNRIGFRNRESGKVKKYYLPLEVKCFFRNGVTKTLVLDYIEKDSLYFHELFDKSFDCRISQIKKIRIKRGLNPLRDILVIGGVFTSSLLFLSSAIGIFSRGAGDPSLAIYIMVFSVCEGIGTYSFQKITQNTYPLNKYEFQFEGSLTDYERYLMKRKIDE